MCVGAVMQKQLRVAMVGWEFPPLKVGGLAVHCYHLARELAQLGCAIDFYIPKTSLKIPSPHPNINIIPVTDSTIQVYLGRIWMKEGKLVMPDLYNGDVPGAISHYSKLCSEILNVMHNIEPYDIIHGHDWVTIKASHLSKLRTHVPWVHTYHSTEYDRNSFPWDYITGIEKLGVDSSDLQITVSNRMKDMLQQKYAANGNRIRVIYNGISCSDFSGISGSQVSQMLKGKKVVLFLGRLTQQKGPKFFLETAKKVLEKRQDVMFVLAGRGELLPELIKYTFQLGIVRNVLFLGFIPDEYQASIYSAADVFVMPSSSEPFGITALEALASGVPTIVSKTSGVSELVKTAFKVDFWDTERMSDTILGILKYGIVKRLMKAIGQEEAKHYTWKKTAEETLRVYRELVR